MDKHDGFVTGATAVPQKGHDQWLPINIRDNEVGGRRRALVNSRNVTGRETRREHPRLDLRLPRHADGFEHRSRDGCAKTHAF